MLVAETYVGHRDDASVASALADSDPHRVVLSDTERRRSRVRTETTHGRDLGVVVGRVLADAFENIGESAGHSTQASAEIPLGIFTGIEATEENRDTLLSLTEEAVTRKLFDAMGVESESGSNGS